MNRAAMAAGSASDGAGIELKLADTKLALAASALVVPKRKDAAEPVARGSIGTPASSLRASRREVVCWVMAGLSIG